MSRFRVALNSWDSYSIVIEARSPKAADKKGRKLWDDVGPEVFKHRDCGVDFIEAQPVREATS